MSEILLQITEKKTQLDRLRPLPPELLANLEGWFQVELTYSSNALEGNTLSRAETALVIEKGLTVAGKTLVEHLEAVNHAEALDYIKSLAGNTRKAISEGVILDIHKLILGNIDDRNAGRYRSVPVRIAGSRVILPNPLKVPELMAELVAWLHRESQAHPVAVAAEAHYRLVSIHPFVDGNGRTARLLMNLLLIQEGYPPAIIRDQDRLRYINALEKAQLGGSWEDFLALIYQAVERSLDIYLESADPSLRDDSGKQLKRPSKVDLLKIGELAKLSGEPTHTIRYWTKEGLLVISSRSQGGYHLYDPAMIARVREIRRLQNQERLTLKEIKARFEQR